MSETIKGLQEAQAAMVQTLGALQPSGAFGRAIRYATAEGHRYAVQITPVDTGAWRAAQVPAAEGLHGRIYLQAGARNPRSRAAVSTYASVWEQRGGDRAVYQRTIAEAGPRIQEQAGVLITQELP